MKKFRNWCNKNEGFIAFWALILYLIFEVFRSYFSKLPIFLKSILDFLTYKINMPIFIILIFLILIIILFRNKIRSWNLFFKKSISNKIIDIISDETTQFIGSPNYKHLVANNNSYAFKDGDYWPSIPNFHELAYSKWICHTRLITDEEAIKGGSYSFEKDFRIDYSIELIEDAVLYLIVDDLCLVSLNDNIIGNFAGYMSLTQTSIKSLIKKGNNKIIFSVTNNSGQILDTDRYSNQINRKGEHNPYGLRFLIRIINK